MRISVVMLAVSLSGTPMLFLSWPMRVWPRVLIGSEQLQLYYVGVKGWKRWKKGWKYRLETVVNSQRVCWLAEITRAIEIAIKTFYAASPIWEDFYASNIAIHPAITEWYRYRISCHELFRSLSLHIVLLHRAEENKIETSVPIFIAATGKVGLFAFLILNATIGYTVTEYRTWDTFLLRISLFHRATVTILEMGPNKIA